MRAVARHHSQITDLKVGSSGYGRICRIAANPLAASTDKLPAGVTAIAAAVALADQNHLATYAAAHSDHTA
jgi:hypothetical protein